jgi:uncharacterized membrane protein
MKISNRSELFKIKLIKNFSRIFIDPEMLDEAVVALKNYAKENNIRLEVIEPDGARQVYFTCFGAAFGATVGFGVGGLYGACIGAGTGVIGGWLASHTTIVIDKDFGSYGEIAIYKI